MHTGPQKKERSKKRKKEKQAHYKGKRVLVLSHIPLQSQDLWSFSNHRRDAFFCLSF